MEQQLGIIDINCQILLVPVNEGMRCLNFFILNILNFVFVNYNGSKGQQFCKILCFLN